MKFLDAVRGSLIAAVCAAGAAHAQSPAAMTDVNFAPAEDRDSVGAVLFEDSMVRAQRARFGQRSTPADVQAIGREVMRKTMLAAGDRQEGPDTRTLGGPPEAAPPAVKQRRRP